MFAECDVGRLGERGDERVYVGRVYRQGHHSAHLLQPGESVHLAAASSLVFPSADDLRYHLAWIDGLGAHADGRQVPVG